MTLRQETDFPAEETTVLTIGTQSPVETTVYLRYPSWSKGVKVAVMVKGGGEAEARFIYRYHSFMERR